MSKAFQQVFIVGLLIVSLLIANLTLCNIDCLAAPSRLSPAGYPAAGKADSHYLTAVKQKLEHYWYPATALNAQVTVAFRIHKNGQVSWLELTDASNVSTVNEAAQDAISYANPFSPLPAGIDHLDLSVKYTSSIPPSMQSGYSRPNNGNARAAYALEKEAHASSSRKDYLTAISKLEQALELTPFNARYKDQLVEVYLLAAANYPQDNDTTAALLHKALLTNPQNVKARNTLATFWRQQGKDPHDFATRLTLARNYQNNHQALDALCEYGEAWLLKQDSQLIPEINLACKQRQASLAIEKWQKVVDYMRTPENLVNLGKSYQLSGDYDSAQAYFEVALKENSSYTFAQVALSELSTKKNDKLASVTQNVLDTTFPYVLPGSKNLKVSVIQNRQPVVDYFRWACLGKAVHRWTPGRFPLRLYVANGYGVPGYRPNFNKMIIDALTSWAFASENRLSFVLVPSKAGANITCTWTANPSQLRGGGNEQGTTYFQFMQAAPGNNTIRSADITILTVARHNGSELDDASMKSICLHEIGHALGIAGHSPYYLDIMYPAMIYGHPITALTAQDKATIKHLYQGYPHLKASGGY